jgi:hypothetical protein
MVGLGFFFFKDFLSFNIKLAKKIGIALELGRWELERHKGYFKVLL